MKTSSVRYTATDTLDECLLGYGLTISVTLFCDLVGDEAEISEVMFHRVGFGGVALYTDHPYMSRLSADDWGRLHTFVLKSARRDWVLVIEGISLAKGYADEFI